MTFDPRSWFHMLWHHNDRALECSSKGLDHQARGITHAILALVSVQRGQLRELRRIRRALEARNVVSIGLTATTTPKERDSG